MNAKYMRRSLIAWLILALLVAQGMRVCLHDFSVHHAASDVHESAAMHLESTLSMFGNHDEEISDVHITFDGILKHASLAPLFALLFVTLLLVLCRPNVARLEQPRDRVFTPPLGHYFSPPLRAPPR